MSKKLMVLLSLGIATLIGAAALLAGLVLYAPDPPRTYTVVRGDTLSRIAREQGVTLDALLALNPIDPDRIEVGQVLLLPDRSPPASPPSPRPGRRRVAAAPTTASAAPSADLRMPAPQRCLRGPSIEGLGERGAAASEGLSKAQVRGAMDAFVPHTLSCLQGTAPRGALELEITVACSGQVASVTVLDGADWPPAVADCVTEVLGYTPFPAHALPDGDVFRYPLRYRPSSD